MKKDPLSIFRLSVRDWLALETFLQTRYPSLLTPLV